MRFPYSMFTFSVADLMFFGHPDSLVKGKDPDSEIIKHK
jgi:hypothetical protein